MESIPKNELLDLGDAENVSQSNFFKQFKDFKAHTFSNQEAYRNDSM